MDRAARLEQSVAAAPAEARHDRIGASGALAGDASSGSASRSSSCWHVSSLRVPSEVPVKRVNLPGSRNRRGPRAPPSRARTWFLCRALSRSRPGRPALTLRRVSAVIAEQTPFARQARLSGRPPARGSRRSCDVREIRAERVSGRRRRNARGFSKGGAETRWFGLQPVLRPRVTWAAGSTRAASRGKTTFRAARRCTML
jgi:hypothetical protein